MSRPMLLLPLLFAMAPAWPAAALPFGTIGGSANQLIRVTGGSHCQPPGTMCHETVGDLFPGDYALDGIAQIFAQGSIDHAAGEISGKVRFKNQVGNGSNGELNLAARDLFTVEGSVVGEAVSITARFRADGAFDIFAQPASAFIEAKLSSRQSDGWNGTNGGIAISSGTCGCTPNVLRDPGLVPFDVEAVDTFNVVTGTPFQLVYALRMNGNIFSPPGNPSGDVTIDSLNTGTLSFDLPAGYTITSALGFGVAPEPGASALLGIGVLGLAVVGRRQGSAQPPRPARARRVLR